jgi:hypothetical protein
LGKPRCVGHPHLHLCIQIAALLLHAPEPRLKLL